MTLILAAGSVKLQPGTGVGPSAGVIKQTGRHRRMHRLIIAFI